MVRYLLIQALLGIGIAIIVTVLHVFQRIVPVIRCDNNFEVEILFPYIVIVICIIGLQWFRRQRNSDYDYFLMRSPGKDINKKSQESGTV